MIDWLFNIQEKVIFFVSTEYGLTLCKKSEPKIQSSEILSSLYKVSLSLTPLNYTGNNSGLAVRETGVPSIADLLSEVLTQ